MTLMTFPAIKSFASVTLFCRKFYEKFKELSVKKGSWEKLGKRRRRRRREQSRMVHIRGTEEGGRRVGEEEKGKRGRAEGRGRRGRAECRSCSLLLVADNSFFREVSSFTLHTAHCTLHTAHCSLHIAYCTLLTAHCILHTAHCHQVEKSPSVCKKFKWP